MAIGMHLLAWLFLFFEEDWFEEGNEVLRVLSINVCCGGQLFEVILLCFFLPCILENVSKVGVGRNPFSSFPMDLCLLKIIEVLLLAFVCFVAFHQEKTIGAHPEGWPGPWTAHLVT